MAYLTLDSNLIKSRSKSFSCLGSNSTVTCSSSSTHDFTHKPRSCYTDYSNPSNHHHIKRFHSSQLGKPPGLSRSVCISEINKPPPPPVKTKIAPMKEVEKLIADLKKENFDLKLRLFHLEDIMTKDLDLYQLKQQNRKLQTHLEVSSKHMESLQQELNILLNKPAISIGIQTDPPTIADDASLNSYFTAFESPLIRRYQFSMDKKIESWLDQIDYAKSTRKESHPQI